MSSDYILRWQDRSPLFKHIWYYLDEKGVQYRMRGGFQASDYVMNIEVEICDVTDLFLNTVLLPEFTRAAAAHSYVMRSDKLSDPDIGTVHAVRFIP